MKIINADMVRQLLPMSECIDVMARAMLATSARAVSIPPREFHALTDNSGSLGVMPGFSLELGTYGVKLITLHPRNPDRGLPAIQGLVALFDHVSGAPLAIMDGAEITAIRTAAASGLATRLLAREDASSCGIFGTGVQAQSHIDAVCAVREIDQILVWGRDTARSEAFARDQAQRTGRPVVAAQNPEEAAACDILCTVTGASEPILHGDWVAPGAHVNLVGAHTLHSREADSALMVRSAIYVDLMESARNESGDIMIPVRQGLLREQDVVGEIGQLVAGQVPGRSSPQQVTVYKSLGITSQDLYAARHVYDRAAAVGLDVAW